MATNAGGNAWGKTERVGGMPIALGALQLSVAPTTNEIVKNESAIRIAASRTKEHMFLWGNFMGFSFCHLGRVERPSTLQDPPACFAK